MSLNYPQWLLGQLSLLIFLGLLTVAGTISQSSYQNPAFESLRAKKRRQTAMRARAHVAILLPRILVSSLPKIFESDICDVCSKLRTVLNPFDSLQERVRQIKF